jgi:aerobic carbon-monoxide dehydrogenase medium subunit
VIPFDLAEPKTLREAVALLDTDDPGVRPIAGGTALMLMMKAGVFQPSRLISLGKIEKEFSTIVMSGGGEFRIGAMTPLSTLESSPEVRAVFPVIAETLRNLANVRVRNVARVGGALAHGDPHMDLPPLLSVLGARAVVVGRAGSREIAVEELYSGYYRTVLEPNELIAEVIVPRYDSRRLAYLKYTTRTADDWPALGVAVSLDTDGRKIRDVRLVISAATEKVTRLPQAEKVLVGAAIEDATLQRAGEAAVAETTLLADARGSAVYKQELLRACIGRAVRMALTNSVGK